jgi:hypothetical protein
LEYLKNNIPKSFSEMEKIIEEEDSDEDDENEKTLKSPKTSGSKKRGGAEPKKKRFQKIELLSKNALKKTKNNNFYLLSSVDVFDQPISVATKKEMLSNFNARPSNVHGEEIRFIIMDSGFKEGIDLFDIKYVHIFEHSVNSADQKQVIGRQYPKLCAGQAHLILRVALLIGDIQVCIVVYYILHITLFIT